MGSTTRKGSGKLSGSQDDDVNEFTTSYRAVYGGPKGLDATSWTDSSQGPSQEQSKSLDSQGTPTTWQTVSRELYRHPATASQLTDAEGNAVAEHNSPYRTDAGGAARAGGGVDSVAVHAAHSTSIDSLSSMSPPPSVGGAGGISVNDGMSPGAASSVAESSSPPPTVYSKGAAHNNGATDQRGVDAVTAAVGNLGIHDAEAAQSRMHSFTAGSNRPPGAAQLAAASLAAEQVIDDVGGALTPPRQRYGADTNTNATTRASPSLAVWAKLEANIAAETQSEAAKADRYYYVENEYNGGGRSVGAGGGYAATQPAATVAAARDLYSSDYKGSNPTGGFNAAQISGIGGDDAGISRETAAAAHQAAVHLSLIATATLVEQKKAAAKLIASINTHGDPVRKATHAAGGVAVLQTMLTHKDKELQQASTTILAELCTFPEARRELASAPDAAANAVQIACKGASQGLAPAAKLLTELAKDDGELKSLFLALCAQHKAVKVLLDAATDPNHSDEAREACMDALEAVCTTDPHSGYRKLAWSGGLSKLARELGSTKKWKPPLGLLLAALQKDPTLAESLCDVEIISLLSQFIANPDCVMELQVGAAFILSCIAGVHLRREEITQALLDHSLPRACEVLHEVDTVDGTPIPLHLVSVINGGKTKEQGQQQQQEEVDVVDGLLGKEADALQHHCAALCGNLGASSDLCCHVLIFHTAVLKTVLMVLVQSKQYTLAKQLLAASSAYASRCDNPVA